MDDVKTNKLSYRCLFPIASLLDWFKCQLSRDVCKSKNNETSYVAEHNFYENAEKVKNSSINFG